MRKSMSIALSVLVSLSFAACSPRNTARNNNNNGMNQGTTNNLSMTRYRDGVYTGYSDGTGNNREAATVTIRNGRIVDVDLTTSNNQGTTANNISRNTGTGNSNIITGTGTNTSRVGTGTYRSITNDFGRDNSGMRTGYDLRNNTGVTRTGYGTTGTGYNTTTNGMTRTGTTTNNGTATQYVPSYGTTGTGYGPTGTNYGTTGTGYGPNYGTTGIGFGTGGNSYGPNGTITNVRTNNNDFRNTGIGIDNMGGTLGAGNNYGDNLTRVRSMLTGAIIQNQTYNVDTTNLGGNINDTTSTNSVRNWQLAVQRALDKARQ